jgi:hypothetical protein
VCQISRDETLDNKPVTFVRKRVKTNLQQYVEFQNFPGEDPRSKGREEWNREEGWGEEGNEMGRLEGKWWKGRAKGRRKDRKKRKRRRV